MPILGIDEVGRGPWAGPLVIGAVILGNPLDDKWQELADSKKLTAKKREKLAPFITKNATHIGLGWVPAPELDNLGLAKTLPLAAMRAICELLNLPTCSSVAEFSQILQQGQRLDVLPFSEIIIDGTSNFLKGTPLEDLVTVLPKADDKIKEVSAASIIAKVARDNYMIDLASKYPEYGFDKHVGYGTAAHKKALLEYGPCPEHRFSFRPVAKIAKNSARNYPGLSTDPSPNSRHDTNLSSTQKGSKAENIVAKYLEENGHKIIARNYKTKFYEIDIVSATSDHIYFTEVKYRKTSRNGQPLEFIDSKKQRQITFAAEAFMNFLSKKLNRNLDDLPSPVLAAAAVSGADFHFDGWIPLID